MINTVYQPKETEGSIYKKWEEGGCFTPKIDPKKKPFTILLPLPNANDPLHIGHALFVVEDILVRFHRMKGEPTLWLPGADHAGIETQYVFEKELAKKGKSRFDFDRETLYRLIYDFVEKNRAGNRSQLKKLGFSLDWSRYHYSLEPRIVKTVMGTFRKLHGDGLIYRDERIVNYCTRCGTAFSDLEVEHKEKNGKLWYIRYPLAAKGRVKPPKPVGFIIVATTRPETLLGDAAVAVHPKDDRYKNLVGGTAVLPIMGRELPIIADNAVSPRFGTGAVKVTPAHDSTDFEIGRKNNLPVFQVIGFDGRMTEEAGPSGEYKGESVSVARGRILKDLRALGLLEKEEDHTFSVGSCYRCKNIVTPLLMPQWFVKTNEKLKIKNEKLMKFLGLKQASLAEMGILAVKRGELKIVPKRFEKLYLRWLENIKDWNISRQIVWGPRIPAWYCLFCNSEIVVNFLDKEGKSVSGRYKDLRKKGYSFRELKEGLQQLTAPSKAVYSLAEGPCQKCGGKNILQETDTFDTWFLSGQWPLTTLGFPDGPDFKYFYPTSVLDTLWDILFFWVARMVMLGIYRAGDIPFRVAHLHCRVVDGKGRKMSKSKGNVVDPLTVVEKYGADALRLALVFGASPGSDICLGDDKVRAMRNFANKVWNVGRFVLTNLTASKETVPFYSPRLALKLTKEDKEILKDLKRLIKIVTGCLDRYRFDLAAERLYHFLWHRFADQYVEYSKERIKEGDVAVLSVLRHVYLDTLKLLHPFMPFLTEEIWGRLPRKRRSPLIISPWPKG